MGLKDSINIKSDMIIYAETLVKEMNSTLKNIGRSVNYKIYDIKNHLNICLISLHFSGLSGLNNDVVEFNDNRSILEEINNNIYEKYAESIYYRKVIKYFTNDICYLIKSNQKRFWSVSQALNDADSILLDIMG